MKHIYSHTWTQLSLKLVFVGLLMACGGVTSTPGGGLGGALTQPSSALVQPPQTVINGAAAPTLEGILSAPADDDNIVNDGKRKVVHFEAFFGPDYSKFLDGVIYFLEPKELKFLVKVGEATHDACQGMEDLSCWKWLDPNLLEGLGVRVRVITNGFVGGTNPSGPALLTTKWYYQDFFLTKVTGEGYNLSLLDLNPKDGDQVYLELLEKIPEDFTTQRSPLFDGAFINATGGGNHVLGSFNIGTLLPSDIEIKAN